MSLLSRVQLRKLQENARLKDPVPVVKLHTPNNEWVWLLAARDTEDRDKLLCLADMGIGQPEMGYVSLSTLEGYDNRGIPILPDADALLDKPLSHYANIARKEQKIVT